MGRMARAAREKQEQRRIAEERIAVLFDEAAKAAAAGRLDRANRYVALAWRLHTRYKVPIPQRLRNRFCRKCRAYWAQGMVRVRTRAGRIVRTCLACQRRKRTPL